MALEDKYSNTTTNDDKKIIINDDTYAVCEMIEILIAKIEKVRLDL